MVMNHRLEFRVTKREHEQIRYDARKKGFLFVSSYLRYLAINYNYFTESKIIETNKNVKKIIEVLGD